MTWKVNNELFQQQRCKQNCERRSWPGLYNHVHQESYQDETTQREDYYNFSHPQKYSESSTFGESYEQGTHLINKKI